jgi:glycosyltransferase involved in cell wall biosynthesis
MQSIADNVPDLLWYPPLWTGIGDHVAPYTAIWPADGAESGGQLSALVDRPVFLVLAFEGPDPYARAGGLGARVTELSEALADDGFETHLFFVGDPDLPGHEPLRGGLLNLHRWCQWISDFHRGGVYDGEEGKLADWNASLAPWIVDNLIAPKVAEGRTVVVLAEEWQTAVPVVNLMDLVVQNGWQHSVNVFWNANHFFGFDRVDWPSLEKAATITTVSRFMRNMLALRGVEARVVPNGISETWFWPLDSRESRAMNRLFAGRVTLVKVARWDRDKGWDEAIAAASELKKRGLRPLLIARGGHEPYGRDVLRRMHGHGLHVTRANWNGSRPDALMEAMAPAISGDVVLLEGFLSLEQRRLLFHTADVVLANSSMEPFGLVGLETMAVGGVAFVGSTGEDYATAGHDAICIETSDPNEIVHEVIHLHEAKAETRHIRERARRSARRYSWPSVLKARLLPLLRRSGATRRPAVRRVAHPVEHPAAAPTVIPAAPLELPTSQARTVA